MTEETQPQLSPMAQHGENLIKLGQAFKDQSSTFEELSNLAAACGLVLNMGLAPPRPPMPPQNPEDVH